MACDPFSVTISASAITIDPGASTVLSWVIRGSTDARSIVITNLTSGGTEFVGQGTPPQSSQQVTPLITTVYQVTVTDQCGNIQTATITINVRPPTVSISASPNPCTSGSTLVLTYSSAGATSLSIDNGIGTVSVPSGTVNVTNFTLATRYTITATGPTGMVATSFVNADVNIQLTTPKLSYATATGSYTVPGDFISYNSVECIGEGGAQTNPSAFGGGGGGAYAKKTSGLAGTTVNVQVGAGASSTDTWLISAGTVMAKAGGTTATNTGAAGGQAGSSVGDTVFSGGNGGNGGGNGGGGGGGAAGLNGAGANGANGNPPINGGTGGNGDAGFGGAGSVSGTNPGGAGQEYDATHGSGGGSGGIGPIVSGAQGGKYGGGSGGNNPAGSPGLIVVNYNAANGFQDVTPITGAISPFPVTIVSGQSSVLTWSSNNATGASLDQGIGSVSTSGTTSVSPIVTTTYNLTLTAPNCTTVILPVTVTVTPLPPPTNVLGTGQCGGVPFTGTASPLATSYNVLRSTTSGSGYTTIATGIDPAVGFTDTTGTPYVIYFYVARAVLGAGISANSNETSAFALAPPSVPSSVTATGLPGAIEVQWGAVPHAASYNVYRGVSSGSEVLAASGLTNPSYNDTNIATSISTFFYKVTAVNSCGETAKSSEVSAAALPQIILPSQTPKTENDVGGVPGLNYQTGAPYGTIYQTDTPPTTNYGTSTGPKTSYG